MSRWQTWWEKLEEDYPTPAIVTGVSVGVILVFCLLIWAVFIVAVLDLLVN